VEEEEERVEEKEEEEERVEEKEEEEVSEEWKPKQNRDGSLQSINAKYLQPGS